MLIEHAWLLKGFVLAHGAPAPVVAAVDLLIAGIALTAPAPTPQAAKLSRATSA